jgi:hypothetical protein
VVFIPTIGRSDLELYAAGLKPHQEQSAKEKTNSSRRTSHFLSLGCSIQAMGILGFEPTFYKQATHQTL